MNEILFAFHLLVMGCFTFSVLKLGKNALNAWLCVLAIAMNLFVTKSITVFGLEVTATDALAASYLLGLCLLQENYGKSSARWHIAYSAVCSIGFVVLGWFQLLYHPNDGDVMHDVFARLLMPFPRLIVASLTSFVIIQLIDVSLFQWIRKKLHGKWFAFRAATCVTVSHIFDSIIFTFLGLAGIMPNLWHIILLSITIKTLGMLIAVPAIGWLHKRYEPQPT